MLQNHAPKWLATGVLAAAAMSSAFALNQADTKFVRGAYQGSWSEVQLGNLVLKRTKSPSVRNFGQKMISDHSRAMTELAALAKKKGVGMPRSVKPEHRQMQDRLSHLNGVALDRAYKKMMVEDHMKDVEEFKEASRNSKDRDVRAAAKKWLPTLQMHLQMARDMRP